jgi:signal transduction histidine kinase
VQGIVTTWRAFEALLRIEERRTGWSVLQARATYSVCCFFIALQPASIFWGLDVYGGWSAHLLTPMVLAVLCGAGMVLLRYTRTQRYHAAFFTVLILVGIVVPALPDHTGIETSVLPYIVLGPLLLCFIGGWRWGFGALPLNILMIAVLTQNTLAGTDGALTAMQELRAQQALFAVLIATFAACAVAAAAQSSLERLEGANLRARQAEAAKSDFLAAMSHELRTPMNGVLGLTEVLLREEKEPLTERQRDLLTTIDNAGTHLLGIVDDILNLSKLEANRVVAEERPLSLHALLMGVRETFAGNAVTKGLRLKLRLGERLPDWVEGDELRIKQIMTNLVSNALKFSEHGEVSIRADGLEARRGWVWIEVRDTGCGIPPERAEAIFEPFEQAERGVERRFGGTGLGLPISRQLAELLGGEIHLKRTGPEGSVFVLMLPLSPAAAQPRPRRLGFDREALKGLRVLVVEDNEVNRLVIGEMLKLMGAEALFAENGREALTALAALDVDAVLMDKHMPEMNGIEATAAIRASGEAWAGVPIIAATADAMEGEEAALLAAGMNGFVSKPVRADRLA